MISKDLNEPSDNTSEGGTVVDTTVPKNFIERLKVKWGLESLFQVIIILLVFSVTGTTVVFLRKTLYDWLGFDDSTALWVKTITYLLFVFPAYQALILFYGSLFGQFEFFWNKEKKLFRLIKRLFQK